MFPTSAIPVTSVGVVVFVPNPASINSVVLICESFVQVSSGDTLVKHDVTTKPALEVGSRSVNCKCCVTTALLCCPFYGHTFTQICSFCICLVRNKVTLNPGAS